MPRLLSPASNDGTVDAIVTDHAPHAAWEKAREFELAPFGMTGLETSLGLVLTNLVAAGHRSTWSDMVELMGVAPRDILGVEPREDRRGQRRRHHGVRPELSNGPSAVDDFCIEGAQLRLRRMRSSRAARPTCSSVAKQRFATALSSNSKHVRGRNRGSLAYDRSGKGAHAPLPSSVS